ncbi:MAG TPA: YtxH domain-containing protein [Nitrospiraceae bacterium]|nr:YtxH domain-containing protein [Nitrospiraceae bacterium]
MADEQGPSSAAVLLGFLSGAALGAVAALLLAPRAGRESRDLLRGYAKRAEDKLRDLVDEAGHQIEEVVEQGRDYLESKKSVLREAFDAGREAMRREREQSKSEQG